jgi:hypothetical protein
VRIISRRPDGTFDPQNVKVESLENTVAASRWDYSFDATDSSSDPTNLDAMHPPLSDIPDQRPHSTRKESFGSSFGSFFKSSHHRQNSDKDGSFTTSPSSAAGPSSRPGSRRGSLKDFFRRGSQELRHSSEIVSQELKRGADIVQMSSAERESWVETEKRRIQREVREAKGLHYGHGLIPISDIGDGPDIPRHDLLTTGERAAFVISQAFDPLRFSIPRRPRMNSDSSDMDFADPVPVVPKDDKDVVMDQFNSMEKCVRCKHPLKGKDFLRAGACSYCYRLIMKEGKGEGE